MPTVQIGAMGMAIQEWGSREPLMLVHGLGLGSELWSIKSQPFLHTIGIAVDLHGFGRSDRLSEPGSHRTDCLGPCRERGWNKPL